MNISDIKSMSSEQARPQRPELALQKQLQREGLEQARNGIAVAVDKVDVKANETFMASHVLDISIKQSLSDTSEAFAQNKSVNKPKDASESEQLFDFKSVAKNVLSFVSGVINKAAQSGAPEDELNSLFSQAREGVDKGIKLALGDIGENITEDTKQGIEKSKVAIHSGIDSLHERIFAPDVANMPSPLFSSDTQKTSEAGSLLVTTKDGDEVRINFSNEQSSYHERTGSSSEIHYSEQSQFSFSVNGEIDKAEYTAIVALVDKADEVASLFYKGDMEGSYQSALQMGFDNSELSGFAMQLQQTESIQKVRKYGEVQHYNEPNGTVDLNAPKSVAQYMNKVLDLMEQTKDTLGAEDQYNNLINGLINQMKDVQVPDLLTAINRFHSFNASLLQTQAPIASEPVQVAE